MLLSTAHFRFPDQKLLAGKSFKSVTQVLTRERGLPAASESRDQTFLPASGKRIGEVWEDRSFVRSGFPFENFRLKIEFYLLSMDLFVGKLKLKN